MKQKYQLFSKVWCSVTYEFCKVISFNSITGEYILENGRNIKIYGVKEYQISL